MSKVLVNFKEGWIRDKDGIIISDNFIKIMKFFVWSTPCNNTSSSEKKMSDRGWSSSVWKDGKLKTYLISAAGLHANLNFAIARKLDEMSNLESKILINGKFQDRRDQNRVLMYNSGKENDILQMFYYIRCALAHGRFDICKEEEKVIYIMEATVKHNRDYVLKARMILKEETLIKWVDAVVDGPTDLPRKIEELRGDNVDLIKKIISDNPGMNRDNICKHLGISMTEAQRKFNHIRDAGIIVYDKKMRRWRWK